MSFTPAEWVRATVGALIATALGWAGASLYFLALS